MSTDGITSQIPQVETSVTRRTCARIALPISLRLAITVASTAIVAAFIPVAWAQAPVNDVIAWPPGLLLLATVLYAALGAAPDTLWNIEPSIGIFMGTGLPLFSISTMKRVAWVTSACHFLPRIRTAHGVSNFWISSDEVTPEARREALKSVLEVMSPVMYQPLEGGQFVIDEAKWQVVPETGLVQAKGTVSRPGSTDELASKDIPSARDFLCFAAIRYHVFFSWDVKVVDGEKLLFATEGTGDILFDVENEEQAMCVVAAQMIRRPHSQSPLRALAQRIDDGNSEGSYILDISKIDKNVPMCSIDFHSYAPDHDKFSASLNEMAGAYYRVISYLKHRCADGTSSVPPDTAAIVEVGQTLWIAILGGVLFDRGRLTIQNLPGRWAVRGASADEAYLDRVHEILRLIKPYANKPKFEDIVQSGGNSRRAAFPFFLAGLFGQILICYFLAVGTTAGVWTTVALSHSLFSGKLTDWHSVYWGKTAATEESGMKMFVPGGKDYMIIATFDRTTPRQGQLRPGMLLNLLGLIAAILGSLFQKKTRDALGFSPFRPSPPWVSYTSIVLCVGVSFLVAFTIFLQQSKEKTWSDDAEIPTRVLIYSTLPASVIVSGLALYFQLSKQSQFWPILDALTWISGFPLGILENGRMISTDHSMAHMVLVNRWLMGAVASAIGSSTQ
ncbi:hypothetical protein B0H34DRAFT_777782 [Crassisporium funariophilum]|nr:hypothetical protein B0H34DRAFT_777782 [Crassisporium funariophilum]